MTPTFTILTPNDDRVAAAVGRWGRRAGSLFGVAPTIARLRTAVELALGGGDHVLYFGHGVRDALIARRGFLHRRTERLCDETNLGRPGRLVVAVACWSAETLGRVLTESRPPAVAAYVGWLDDVSFPGPDADRFSEAVLDGLRVLSAGGTIGECADAMQASFDALHEEYRNGSNDRHNAKMQASYWSARLRCLGDPQQRL